MSEANGSAIESPDRAAAPEPRREVILRMSGEIAELAGALAAAQGEIEMAAKDSENPHFHRTYADLASVWRACRRPLAKHGLAVVQVITQGTLLTRLLHKSGQWIEGDVRVTPDGATGRSAIQALGSALTYLRRYTLAAMVGVAPDDDDDGEGSEDQANASQSNRRRRPYAPGPSVDDIEQPYAEEAPPKRSPAVDVRPLEALFNLSQTIEEVREAAKRVKALAALSKEQLAHLRKARAAAEERITKAAATPPPTDAPAENAAPPVVEAELLEPGAMG